MLLQTPTNKLGQTAPDFTLPDPDGNIHTMSDYLSEHGLLVMFICNHCPYVQRIADRLASDCQTLIDQGINVLAIMSNDYHSYPADAPEQMSIFAAQHNFAFPYLIDEDQSIGKAYGAVCTPDFFGINGQGHVQYRGRLDDARMGDPSNRTPELLHAMQHITQTGTGPAQQYPSMGCSIKWRNT